MKPSATSGEAGPPSPKGRLETLDEATCWSLLGSKGVGRLSWTSALRPVVVPVNYRLWGGRLEVITAAYSAIARECDDAYVALEADQTDEADHSGWSVLVQGTAAFDHRHPATSGPRPWPAGVRRQRLVITPTSVTGRRLV